MKKLIFLFFLVSCAGPSDNLKKVNKILDFNKNLNFDEFNTLSKKYSDMTLYPNINK